MRSKSLFRKKLTDAISRCKVPVHQFPNSISLPRSIVLLSKLRRKDDKVFSDSSPKSPLDDLGMGLLRIRVKRGINLAVRDVCSSDPYVVLKMGKQKVMTRVIKNSVNPQWNEDLTLSVTDPNQPIKLIVYDHDTFSKDDRMGEAEFEIKPFMEALKTNISGLPSGTIISTTQPSKQNCLAEETSISYVDGGKVIQNICLRLKNVECGTVEIQLQWIDLPKD